MNVFCQCCAGAEQVERWSRNPFRSCERCRSERSVLQILHAIESRRRTMAAALIGITSKKKTLKYAGGGGGGSMNGRRGETNSSDLFLFNIASRSLALSFKRTGEEGRRGRRDNGQSRQPESQRDARSLALNVLLIKTSIARAPAAPPQIGLTLARFTGRRRVLCCVKK